MDGPGPNSTILYYSQPGSPEDHVNRDLGPVTGREHEDETGAASGVKPVKSYPSLFSDAIQAGRIGKTATAQLVAVFSEMQAKHGKTAAQLLEDASLATTAVLNEAIKENMWKCFTQASSTQASLSSQGKLQSGSGSGEIRVQFDNWLKTYVSTWRKNKVNAVKKIEKKKKSVSIVDEGGQ